MSESLQLHSKYSLEMFSGYYICKRMVIIACSLIHAGWPFSKMHDQQLLCLYKIEVVEGLGSFLSNCLMQLANKQYTTTVSSACLQPGGWNCFCSVCRAGDCLVLFFFFLKGIWAKLLWRELTSKLSPPFGNEYVAIRQYELRVF